MSASGSPGPSTDRHNEPVFDPSENVKELVALAIVRLDDLRIQSEKYLEKIVGLQATHSAELRVLEASRIDAIRAVDVAASQQATKDAEIRATALAKQVTDSAEAMRSQVAAAAAAAATSLAAALAPIQQSLAELTQRMYEQQGQKQQVVEARATDADFAPILQAIQSLQKTADENAGGQAQTVQTRAGWSVTAQLIALGVSLFALVFLAISTIVGVYLATR